MNRVCCRLFGSAVALLLAGLLITGCSEDEPGAVAPIQDQPAPGFDLNDPYGGFTMTDEEPAFGDPELLAQAALEVDAGDDAGSHPEIGDMEGDPSTTVYALGIVWGNLSGRDGERGDCRDMDGTDYDWSGSISVTTGALVLKNTISFERRDGDRVILPRTDRQTLQWVSHTGCGFDGLRLMIYQRGSDGGSGVLRFETALYTREIPVSDLADLDEVIDVDHDGNQIRFLGTEARTPHAAGRGFMRGRWGAMAPGDSVGHFQGVWVCPRGGVEGYMRGYYGHNDIGRRVMFGKYIDENGGFKGILRGTWNVARDGGEDRMVRMGTFEGRWVSDTDSNAGSIAGRWQIGRGGHGHYDGRWWTSPPPPVRE